MESDPKIQSFNEASPAGEVAARLPASAPPVTGAAASSVAGPPPLQPKPSRNSWTVRGMIALLLSLFLGLFMSDAVVSLADDSLILCLDNHVLAAIRGVLFFFSILMAFVVYGLMGLTPMIPKAKFLPVTLFSPVVGLIGLPFLIYFDSRVQQIAWVTSFCQVILGMLILYWTQGSFKFRLPLVAENQLEDRRFSWRNLSVFGLANIFVLLPAVVGYLVFCAALAVDHFSEGFMALRPGGLAVQVRKYTRSDGKTIQLVPMSHVAEPEFYRELSQSFPTNSIILMEGVSDNRHLLTNKITYKRMANSLGVAEQVKEFKPTRGNLVRADVDVDQFTTGTIDFLNLIMLIHSKGVNADTVLKVMQFSPPPHFEEQLLEDVLRKRNRRLLEEIHARLSQSENIIVPWGVAHMPEIAKEIERSGFRVAETREYVAIRFRSSRNKSKRTGDETKTATDSAE
jgi:hypothetical protein